MRKLIDWLFEPDDYDGVTRFDIITTWVWMAGWGMLIAFLIKIFCQEAQ